MRLSDLKVKQTAIIAKVNRTSEDNVNQPDLVASRLETLGFCAWHTCTSDHKRYFWW